MSELGSLLALEYGEALPAESRSGSGFPVFGSNGEVGRHRDFLIPEAGIIVGRKGSVGKVAWSDEPFWPIDTTYWVHCSPEDKRWLYWVLSWLPLARLDTSTGIPGLNRNDVYALKVDRPQAGERQRIAEVLDTLDTAIHETEAIIAKLKAVKQGLLHDLLTRGIDANGELRPHQAEAPHLYKQSPLGWIPKEWDAVKFAEVGEVILGRQSSPRYRSGRNMRPYLRVLNVSDDRLDLHDVKSMNFDPSDFSRFRLQYGDVLLTEGDLASAYTVGRSAVYRGEIEGCCFQNTLLRFRPIRPQYSGYFHYVFCHLRATGRFAVATTATTVHHLSAGRLTRELFLPVAEPGEMEGIAQKLTSLEARIDDETDDLRKRREQQSGLMDDLLTGRVRVTPLLETATP